MYTKIYMYKIIILKTEIFTLSIKFIFIHLRSFLNK